MQVSYPDDIGVGSFDDWDWMELADITAIHQPSYELGAACVSRLIERIQKPDLPLYYKNCRVPLRFATPFNLELLLF